MAVDGEKLVSRIEQRFGVRIPDEEVARIQTIGHLCDHLGKQAREVRQRTCVAAWTFYRLRRVLLDALPLEKTQVRPKALLADLIPARQRRTAWKALENEFEFGLPDLVAPPAMRFGLIAFAAISLVAMLGFVVATASYDYLIVLPFVWAVILGLVLLFTKPFARGFPPELATVADAVRLLAPFQGLPRTVDDKEVDRWILEEVREEVARFTATDATKLSRKTHFLRDLKVK